MKNLSLNNTPTMSSREIAHLTSKRHDNVIRDIKYIEQELGQLISEESYYINSQNKKQPQYLLNKDNTLLVVSGYSIALRKSIIDRWSELENKKQFSLPNNYVEALEALLESEKSKQLALQEVKEKQKTIELLSHIKKTYTSSELAKELNLKSAQELNKKLHNDGYIYKVNGSWMFYAKYSNKGYAEIKQGIHDDHVYYNMQFTQKGREFILNMFDKVNNNEIKIN